MPRSWIKWFGTGNTKISKTSGTSASENVKHEFSHDEIQGLGDVKISIQIAAFMHGTFQSVAFKLKDILEIALPK
ncbi:hypothetical protein CHS0354_018759 [Potamilus streckersoni]|uniref:Uncharacterized protein n=1 Tax=Potamilus streckersoni TaxID=2493646 RepID=A0AAE0W7C1_9BIVA|nr:hypothetical protein CHS0354_018759 [Potamilus streckersoni]